MKHPFAFLFLLSAIIILSFASSLAAIEIPQDYEDPIIEASEDEGPREEPERPAVPSFIMGMGNISPENMAAYLINVNPEADRDFVGKLAVFYIEEAALEEVNHDVAFAQMCLETGYLGFGNLVTPEQYNFAGLGAKGPGFPGLSFPDPRTGVRAQIQHLKAYATDAPLNQELVNPRYFLVRLGSAPTISALAGTWAEDIKYAEKISNVLEQMYFFSLETR